jgi:hypothetical protein
MPSADSTRILEIISLLAAAALAFKLLATGLWKRYPIFFLYFVFRIPNTAWPLLIDVNSNTYEQLWMLTEPITWLFHVLVVVELYRLVLERHKGIYTLGRWAMYGALAIAIPLSVISLIPHFTPHTPQTTRYMGYEFATARGIDFALAIFLLLILLFLSRYPIKLSRNVVVHATLYTFFFFAAALTIFLRSLFGLQSNHAINISLLGFSSVCIVAWLVFLSPHGEEVQAHFPVISPQRERSALRQLESLNATLLKVSGK